MYLKIIGASVAILLASLGAWAAVNGDRVRLWTMLLTTHLPATSFAQMEPPKAPDYGTASAWAALPDVTDSSDTTPEGVVMTDPAAAPADVFFIHPTTFFSNDAWNQSLTDAAVNARTDSGPMRGQASAFNGCCRVFAPRFRQASFAAMIKAGGDSDKAQQLAVEDVVRAFQYYLDHFNQGRPFIIASHSQGSRIAADLIPRMIDAKPVQARFIAAYVVGTWLPKSWFDAMHDIKPCVAADDTGCVATWSTLADNSDQAAQRKAFAQRNGHSLDYADQPFICINPQSWTATAELAPESTNLGAWAYGAAPSPRKPDPGMVNARCINGAVLVSQPADSLYTRAILPGGNYHMYDFNLFYMNIRANAQDRVKAFLAKMPAN
jgi:hypothetical protein